MKYLKCCHQFVVGEDALSADQEAQLRERLREIAIELGALSVQQDGLRDAERRLRVEQAGLRARLGLD